MLKAANSSENLLILKDVIEEVEIVDSNRSNKINQNLFKF